MANGFTWDGLKWNGQGSQAYDAGKYYYGVETYSDDWFELMDEFARKLAEYRTNMTWIRTDLLLQATGTDLSEFTTGIPADLDWSLFDRYVETFRNRGFTSFANQHLIHLLNHMPEEEKPTDAWSTKLPDALPATDKFLRNYLGALSRHFAEKGWTQANGISWYQHILDEPARTAPATGGPTPPARSSRSTPRSWRAADRGRRPGRHPARQPIQAVRRYLGTADSGVRGEKGRVQGGTGSRPRPVGLHLRGEHAAVAEPILDPADADRSPAVLEPSAARRDGTSALGLERLVRRPVERRLLHRLPGPRAQDLQEQRSSGSPARRCRGLRIARAAGEDQAAARAADRRRRTQPGGSAQVHARPGVSHHAARLPDPRGVRPGRRHGPRADEPVPSIRSSRGPCWSTTVQLRHHVLRQLGHRAAAVRVPR